MNNINLSSLLEGESGTVAELYNTGDMRRRLMDIGLIKGTHITCLHKSPTGDPTAYLIRGAVIALRKKDSEKILILNSQPNTP